MPLLEDAVRLATHRFPKTISPRNHAIIDYAVAAAFIAVGLTAWPRRKRVAIPALILGGTQIALSMLTDYPGGVTDVISLETHLDVDALRSGVVAGLPRVLGFKDAWHAWFFRGEAMGMAAVAGLTDNTFKDEPRKRIHVA
jgi:hypothetical protein